MLRNVLIGAAMAAALSGIPARVSAQPPSPPQVASKIDRDVHRAVTSTDRAIHRVVHPRTYYERRHVYYTRTPHVYYSTPYHVRALCRDGRFHIGRTLYSACAGHGGLRG
jgi:hypothetical protein